MNILTFKYTKAAGSESNRVFLPSIYPNKMYEGIDISELSQEEQARFAFEYDEIYSIFVFQKNLLLQEFDLDKSYRRFDPEKMTEVVKESI